MRRRMFPLLTILALVAVAVLASVSLALAQTDPYAPTDPGVPTDPYAPTDPYVPTNPYVPTDYVVENPANDPGDDDPVVRAFGDPRRAPALAYGGPFSADILAASATGALGFGGATNEVPPTVGLAVTGSSALSVMAMAFLMVGAGAAMLLAGRERDAKTGVNIGM